MMFQSTDDKLGESRQVELSGIQFASTATRDLVEMPTASDAPEYATL